MKTFQRPLHRPNLLHRFSALLIGLAVLVVASPAFCGPIHDAARAGDLAKVQALVKADPALVSSKDDQYGQTPLQVAAFNDRKEIVEFLLANKADVNAKAKNGSTALHLAAAKGNQDIVDVLVANKADVNATDNEGWSPVHSAITWNHKEIEDLLTKDGGKDLPAKPTPPPPAPKGPPKETSKDGHFTAYDNQTVLDTTTNLMWASRDNGAPMSWPDAKTFATNYKGGDYTDWRLPTEAELAGLFDKAKSRRSYCAAAVDELGVAADEVHLTDLIHITCTRLWTSEARSDKPDSVTVYDFHAGKDAARPGAKEFVDTASRILVVRNAAK
jgi:hypothetical protein